MTKDEKLTKRQAAVVAKAAEAIAKNPERATAILRDVYECAIKDFEIFNTGILADKDGNQVHHYQRTFPKWDPKPWAGPKK